MTSEFSHRLLLYMCDAYQKSSHYLQYISTPVIFSLSLGMKYIIIVVIIIRLEVSTRKTKVQDTGLGQPVS